MVNALNSKTWFVDAVDADVIDDKALKVKSVRWVFPGATALDAVIIRDPVLNTTLWETTAAGANTAEEVLLETWWPNGFEVPTLAGGNLYITLE